MVVIQQWPDVPDLDMPMAYFIEGFIRNSNERELTVQKVWRMMREVPNDECAFFVIRLDGLTKGYLFAQTMPDEYGEKILLVQSAYVEGVKENYWPEMVRKLEEFGKSKGCETMYFTTRRSPKAFMRLLRTKWTLDSHVMKHDFAKEPCGTPPVR